MSIVLHHLMGWRTELTALCMDIPLLLIGIYFLGPRFGIKTVICTFAIPFFMGIIHEIYGYEALLGENQQLLSAIFGGIVYGIGIGMIAYTILKVFTGRAKDVSVLTYVISLLFLLKFFLIV